MFLIASASKAFSSMHKRSSGVKLAAVYQCQTCVQDALDWEDVRHRNNRRGRNRSTRYGMERNVRCGPVL